MNIPLTPLRFLRYAEQQYPGRTAVVCHQERFTYAQFSERVGRLAGALRQAGVQPGDRVAFLSANCHRLLEAYYGVPEAGAVLLPLNIRLASEELAYILNDSGATILFVEKQFLGLVESFRKNLRAVRKFVQLDGSPEASWLAPHNYDSYLSVATPHRADISSVDENSLAELFYTSGTSANPKKHLPPCAKRLSRIPDRKRGRRTSHHPSVPCECMGSRAFPHFTRGKARHDPAVRDQRGVPAD